MDQFEYSEKVSTGLELILQTESEFETRYTLIIRHTGDIRFLTYEITEIDEFEGRIEHRIRVIPLLNNFAVAYANRQEIIYLAGLPEILYMDITRQLVYEEAVSQTDRASSCFPVRIDQNKILTGSGILVAVIDSGIDIYHPAFIKANGESRILSYWDQNQSGNPPEPYRFGTEYNHDDIQFLLTQGRNSHNFDRSGHGTAVASIITALAVDCMLIPVSTRADTAAFLCAVDYAVRVALREKLPLVINLSYGNNYGDHLGNSQVEDYLNQLQATGKISVVAGMGNDGNTSRHKEIISRQIQIASFYVSNGILAFNLQLWSEFGTPYQFLLTAPNGEKSEMISILDNNQTFILDLNQTRIAAQVGSPSPYNIRQEIFISFFGHPIASGIWQLNFIPIRGQEYSVNAWLPVAASVSADVFFENPTETLTLTIPASARRVISVGAYNSRLQSVSPFSGRGVYGDGIQKPDLVAPGVNIKTALVGGGYSESTGTSFATPFVSAAAALLMQWGITDGNDPFLYGERVKAYLHSGAFPLPGTRVIPNPTSGWGALCAKDSFPIN